MDMNSNSQPDNLNERDRLEEVLLNVSLEDPLWKLLSADAKAHPVAPSPWFAAQTVAKAKKRGQWNIKALLFRWLLPIPLAGLASAALLLFHGTGSQGLLSSDKARAYSYVSSDSDFELHMDLLSSRD